MHKQLEQVLEFHQVFSCHTETAPTVALPSEVPEVRCRLMHEELDEYRDAVEAGDIVGVADALSDLLYVVLGTYISHGFQEIAEKLFDEIHRSNMSKLDANGNVLLREDRKVLKSDRWSAPDLQPILTAAARDTQRSGQDPV